VAKYPVGGETVVRDEEWTKVGWFEDEVLLREAVQKIRRRWADHYSFRVLPAADPRDGFALYLKKK